MNPEQLRMWLMLSDDARRLDLRRELAADRARSGRLRRNLRRRGARLATLIGREPRAAVATS